jgi:hypothetical protein
MDLPHYNKQLLLATLVKGNSGNPFEDLISSPNCSPFGGSDYYCTLCRKKFANESTLQLHEQGTKHKKQLQALKGISSPTKIPDTPNRELENKRQAIEKTQLQPAIQILSSNPNQAFKVIYQAAQALFELHFIKSGANALISLIQGIQASFTPQTDSAPQSPFMHQTTTGRLILLFKSTLIIARCYVFHLNRTEAYKYFQLALSCFIDCNQLLKLDPLIESLPSNLILQQTNTLYQKITEFLPRGFLSPNTPDSPDSPHGVYNLLYPVILEVAGFLSGFQPTNRSLLLYFLAYSMAEHEKQYVFDFLSP